MMYMCNYRFVLVIFIFVILLFPACWSDRQRVVWFWINTDGEPRKRSHTTQLTDQRWNVRTARLVSCNHRRTSEHCAGIHWREHALRKKCTDFLVVIHVLYRTACKKFLKIFPASKQLAKPGRRVCDLVFQRNVLWHFYGRRHLPNSLLCALACTVRSERPVRSWVCTCY